MSVDLPTSLPPRIPQMTSSSWSATSAPIASSAGLVRSRAASSRLVCSSSRTATGVSALFVMATAPVVHVDTPGHLQGDRPGP